MTNLEERIRSALSGRYTIESELGRGGMATVYRARDIKHDRAVAIKVLHLELAAALGPERFLREIKIAARLNHPHILPLHDSGEADGFLYFVMPLVEGESLRDRLTREKQLPVDDALRIAREVADALSYAHAHDVVHRDIKPENILLEGGHAVVADFGIARAISAAGGEKITQTGMSVGTPGYMSPEQAAGDGDVDGRSDLYSLACVLYEMLAGQPPFTGATTQSLVRQHMLADPPNITRVRPAVPAEVATALVRALAKAPADRFNPVALFGEALGRRDATAPSVPATPNGVSRRTWQITIACAVIVAVVLGGLSVLRGGAAAATANARKVIAVLPLQNLTTDTVHAYFAGGLHDEILTQLSKISALTVISRTSVLSYAGKNTPVKQIARELGAGTIVEGTVQAVGGRLRVNVDLIDAATNALLWGERYDRTLDDAFAIQSDVAQKVAAAVGAALTSGEQRGLVAAPTTSAEAYRLYLQGREYLLRSGRIQQNWEIAQKFFERSVALDSGFVLAHVALSEVHGNNYFWRRDPSAARVALLQKEAETAIRLAPDLPQAHAAMGSFYYRGRGDYRRALGEFAVAAKGLPNDAGLTIYIASVHRRLGDWDDAIEGFHKASQLDPRDANTLTDLGVTLLQVRRYAEATGAFDRAVSIAPDVYHSGAWRALGYVVSEGRLDTLRALLNRVPREATLARAGSSPSLRAQLFLWARQPDSLFRVLAAAPAPVFDAQVFFLPTSLYAGWAHQLRGDRSAASAAFDSARTLLDSVMKTLPTDWRIHAARGLALAGLGRRDDALVEAEWIKQSPIYRNDAYDGPLAVADRAQILAQVGKTSAALDEVERLLSHPSLVSVHTLQLDPRWDPLRQDPRFKSLLTKFARP